MPAGYQRGQIRTIHIQQDKRIRHKKVGFDFDFVNIVTVVEINKGSGGIQ